jgi:NADPH:quinone reductase-like Zn-dependent oxidoreductase
VAWGAGQALVMEDVEVAPPGPMEIRVKVVSTSICRSDVNQWQNTVRTGTTKQLLLSKSPTFAFHFIPSKTSPCLHRACRFVFFC